MDSPPIANGAKIFTIGGGVKLQKSNEKYSRLVKVSIFLHDLLK